MIHFAPGHSGINSMLGQMMWFKRFAQGHGLDFTFAVDLDRSPRNFVTRSIHSLLFGDAPKNDLDLPFDETIGLNAFFRQVVAGTFALRGRKILVLAGETGNPREPGLWRSHGFQLHCLENGFLSARYPYWAIDLAEHTGQGEIAASGRVAPAGGTPRRLFAHMRLGDSVVLSSEEIAEATGARPRGDVLATSRMMTATEFSLYRMGLHGNLPPRHYAERGARLVDPEVFAQALSTLQERAGPDLHTVFASDGYSRAAAWLAPKLGLPAPEIEAALNRRLFPVTSRSSAVLIGENGDNLADVLWHIAEADLLLTTSSLFVPVVKCALVGLSAFDGWTMVDATDSLSHYLQLPAVADHPLPVFQARLKRLMAEETMPEAP